MRILIYGAGVIGSFYASRFVKAGLDVTVLARGQRLKELQGHGLWYRGKTRTHKVEVKTISELKPNDRYQFIFLTVRENQVEEALEDISRNESPNVVTMVNTIKPYGRWRKSAEKAGSFRHFRERAAVSKVGFWMHSFCQEQSSRQHSVRSEEERAAGKKHWHTYLEKATFHIRSFRKCITGRSHILA
mgnify:CR=1 FL=1